MCFKETFDRLSISQKIFLISNVIVIPIGSFVLIFIMGLTLDSRILQNDDYIDISNTFYSSPLKNILKSKENLNENPLFGRYNGLIGCSGSSFDYNHFYGTYYYEKKTQESYEELLKSTVKKGGNCPKDKKSCGLLNKESILCLPINEDCPINDIIINNQSSHSENNLIYNSLQFGDDYIHFTNQKKNNQIILDLIMSIESPVSRIEIKKKDKIKTIFKLSSQEEEFYYSGDINEINVYKKIYKTNFTLGELFEKNDVLPYINIQKDYKKEYLNSNIFIYKRYPVPLTNVSKEELFRLNDTFFNSFFHACCFGIPLCFTGPLSFQFTFKNSNICLAISYIMLTGIDSIIFIFFFKDKNAIFSDSLEYIKYRNNIRKRLLYIYIIYVIIGVYQNLTTLIMWGNDCKEQKLGLESNETNLPKKDTKLLPM